MRNFSGRLIAVACAAFFMLSALSVALAADSPAPPKATPKAIDRVKLNSTLRAFYFTRSNACCYPKRSSTMPADPRGGATQNAAAFNLGGKIHAEYSLPNSPLTLGATYFGAEPFGANDNRRNDPSAAYAPGFDPCAGKAAGFNSCVDNTLPGFELSSLGEMYLQYKTKWITAQIGKESINTPWANPSDSRIVPVTFQGATLSINFAPGWTASAMRMARWKNRTSSSFDANSLLCNQAPTPANFPGPACKRPDAGPGTPTSGFLLLGLSRKFSPYLTASVYNYEFYDVANMTHIEAKYSYSPKSPLNPYLAGQYIAESDAGRAIVGAIHNHTIGAQLGASFSKEVDVALSFDSSPIVTYVTATPASVFLPVGGTPATGAPVPGAPAGTNYLYGGGIASPYTDSYATDPLYTTSITQGMADRRSAGSALKLAATAYTSNRHFRGIVSRATYNYSTPAGTSKAAETNLDVTYFFDKVDPKKPYSGLSLRHRLAIRDQTQSPFTFMYNRTQLEYSF
ncbi:MAG: OprD family porin [Candidatus Eremiobacteraeota bacterium]|nr:OprD family porin [Candidatus Eremiobacteraeota bacterium]